MTPNAMPSRGAIAPPGPVLTVSQLLLRASNALVAEFGSVAVEGEVSSFHHHVRSGHMYWTLKDASSEVRCAMFRSDNRRLGFDLADGIHVVVVARPTIFQGRGQFQLQVTDVLPQGRGALYLQFEALKKRLSAEGLFDAGRKRPLPFWPRRIGVVTSSEGAALRDIVTVIRRRAPGTVVLLKAVPVQGPGAAPEIARAIRWFDVHRGVEVVIVGRGGGSIEDLWAFNEEAVVRAVAESLIPVVSAVGHETDTTLVDYAAELRAPTPSAAAERVVPETREIARTVAGFFGRLVRATERQRQRRLESALALIRRYGFRRVRDRFGESRQRWGEGVTALPGALRRQRARRVEAALAPIRRYGFRRVRDRLIVARRRWEIGAGALAPSLAFRADEIRLRLADVRAALPHETARQLERTQTRFEHLNQRLRAADPLAILDRGYAVVLGPDDRVAADASRLAIGDPLKIRLARGRIEAEVTGTHSDAEKGQPS
ncbi:exodeoxyribonuclease VII large subunit [soil metagenome]